MLNPVIYDKDILHTYIHTYIHSLNMISHALFTACCGHGKRTALSCEHFHCDNCDRIHVLLKQLERVAKKLYLKFYL